MGKTFENDGEEDDLSENFHENADDECEDDSDLVDLNGPQATRKIMRNRWLPIDMTLPADIAVDPYAQFPVVIVIDEDGVERQCFLIGVCLPSKGREFTTRDAIEDDEDVIDRKSEAWKLSGWPPYWIMVGEMAAGCFRRQVCHVFDVVFPGGRIPAIHELTRGNKLIPVDKSPDMRKRPMLQIKALIRRFETFLRSLMQW